MLTSRISLQRCKGLRRSDLAGSRLPAELIIIMALMIILIIMNIDGTDDHHEDMLFPEPKVQQAFVKSSWWSKLSYQSSLLWLQLSSQSSSGTGEPWLGRGCRLLLGWLLSALASTSEPASKVIFIFFIPPTIRLTKKSFILTEKAGKWSYFHKCGPILSKVKNFCNLAFE